MMAYIPTNDNTVFICAGSMRCFCENVKTKSYIESLSWLSVLSSHLSAKTLMAPSPLSSHFLGSPLPGRAVVTEGHFSLVKQNQRLIRMN